MTGLREYVRDLELPAREGQHELAPPDETRALELVIRHLHRSGPAPVAAHVVYARWKPGVAVAAAYAVELEDGRGEIVTYKRHLAAKEGRGALDGEVRPGASGLRAGARIPELGATLWTFPADRTLRGAARIADRDRTAHAVDRAGLFQPQVVRRRPSAVRLLRYKPERRCVFLLDLKLRGPEGTRTGERIAARVHAPATSRRIVAARRRALAPAPALGPRLLWWDERSGALFEEWVEGSVPEPLDFTYARATAALAAELHGLRPPEELRPPPAPKQLGDLFAVDPGLLRLYRRAAPYATPPRPARVWIHGDLHPDQVVHDGRGRARLLDLDSLRPGTPEEDLATYVADRMACRPYPDFVEAAGELLEGYGGAVDEEELRRRVGAVLARLAAASLRRLEVDAIARASVLLGLAADLRSQRGAAG